MIINAHLRIFLMAYIIRKPISALPPNSAAPPPRPPEKTLETVVGKVLLVAAAVTKLSIPIKRFSPVILFEIYRS